jgi:DNA-binding NarL/FixJ family response regulator
MRPMALRVVLAEDNYLVREGTAALLNEVGGVDVVATASDLEGLLAAVEEHRPDAVVTDIRMPPGFDREGIDAARAIRRDHPDVGVVVLSMYVRAEYAHELLQGGAGGLGYLLKERVTDVDGLVQAIHRVVEGESVLDPRVVEELVDRRDRAQGSPLRALTPRERQVLEQMAQGKNNAAIGRSMLLTERAVEKYINTIFHKLGLSRETEVHRRVLAVLTFLRATGSPADP